MLPLLYLNLLNVLFMAAYCWWVVVDVRYCCIAEVLVWLKLIPLCLLPWIFEEGVLLPLIFSIIVALSVMTVGG